MGLGAASPNCTNAGRRHGRVRLRVAPPKVSRFVSGISEPNLRKPVWLPS
jgi:hypothetical protein